MKQLGGTPTINFMDNNQTKNLKDFVSLAIISNSELTSFLLKAPRIITEEDIYAKTDGKVIKIGKLWFQLDKHDKFYYLIKACLHCAFRHHYRSRDLRVPQLENIWHVATSSLVNMILKDYMASSSDLIYPANNKIDYNTEIKPLLQKVGIDISTIPDADAIFLGLVKGLDKQEIQPQEIPIINLEELAFEPKEFDESDEVLKANGLEAETINDSFNDKSWSNKIKQFADASKSKLSDNSLKILNTGYQHKVDWGKTLRAYLLDRLRQGPKIRNYSRPSRRSLVGIVEYFQPATQNPKGIRNMVVCIDVSGSCFDAETQEKFAAHIDHIHRETKCNLTAITFDYGIREIIELTHSESIANVLANRPLKGGGGTEFTQPIAEAMKYSPRVIVMLTDCMARFGDKPNADVIWVDVCGNNKPPWGIHILAKD